MDRQSPIEIWFGPGGTYGAFGAGVARGMHLAIAKGALILTDCGSMDRPSDV